MYPLRLFLDAIFLPEVGELLPLQRQVHTNISVPPEAAKLFFPWFP